MGISAWDSICRSEGRSPAAAQLVGAKYKCKTMDEGKEDKEDENKVIGVDKEGDNGIKKNPAVETGLNIEVIFANTEEGEDKWSSNGLIKNVKLKPLQP